MFILLIEGPGVYTVKVQSANRFGNGKAAYLNNVQVSASPTSQGVRPRGTSDAVVIGGIVGSIVFFVFAVIVFLSLRHFIRHKQRQRSIQVNMFLAILVS